MIRKELAAELDISTPKLDYLLKRYSDLIPSTKIESSYWTKNGVVKGKTLYYNEESIKVIRKILFLESKKKNELVKTVIQGNYYDL